MINDETEVADEAITV